MSSRLVIALDFASSEEALAFVGKLRPEQCRLKVGLELFSIAGPALVRELVARGFDVFLDLKFHDIPTTVARACRAAAELGVWMLNVHTLGGSAMMRAARDAIDAGAQRPLLIGVTILTSHNDADVRQIGLGASPADEVARLAALAQESGLDGVVCSPHEAGVLRASRGPKFVLVTPGVRPSGAARDDQSRAATPGEALAAGASYLVVGRPVTRAADPLTALNAIRAEMGEA